ncbi:peptidase S8/S53 domain-containing protein [Glomus cerebriforme]|uniref:Peptidase S8/S53 domain-containing protein n=1 Tax=Glomus cerebriforme TaxID=658196 RepID=A0A397SL01_9GLOM|nr:peptidase S8/S53 domain-containing protein [Glomus cerebriforme]
MIAINDDMVIANKTESLTDSLNALNTEKTNLKNLDRIDQKNFPLDGKYTFPASAGEDVNVYVIDTGININHIDFQGRARFAASFCNGCPLQDDNGHGSMVAGIIGGNFFGVAKKTNLIAVKVLDSFGQGTLLSVIDGMAYVFEQHTAATNKKTVVNMSLIVTTKSQILNTVLAKLVQAGIVVSVAAGNDATDACNESPSSAPEALTVGATQLDNDTIASFSNWGPCIDIFAPGVNIESSGGFTPDHVVVGSGTSFSSPHVAGTAALILGDNQNVLSPAQVAEEIIKISTKNAVKGLNSLPKKTPNRFLRVPQKW